MHLQLLLVAPEKRELLTACREPHSQQVITTPPGRLSRPLPASTPVVLPQLRHSAVMADTRTSLSRSMDATSELLILKRPVLGMGICDVCEVPAFNRSVRSREVVSM